VSSFPSLREGIRAQYIQARREEKKEGGGNGEGRTLLSVLTREGRG